MKTIKQVEGDKLTRYAPPEARPRYRDTLKDLTVDIGGELAQDAGKGAAAIGKGLFKAVKFIATAKSTFDPPERYQPKREPYRPEPWRPTSRSKDPAPTPKIEKPQQRNCCRCCCCHHD